MIFVWALLGGCIALVIVALPLWLAMSDRYLGTDFFGIKKDD